MAFDKPTRNRLASFVGKARDLIAAEFTQQFQSLYGISDKGTITPLVQLGHLDDTGLATAALLRERIAYLVKTHPNDREGTKAAVARLAREQAFTVLNRLAAIRMAEKRGLIVESVGKGYQSKGFKVFDQVAGAGLGETYQRYCRYLYCLFDELAVDLGVLFDRRSPQGLIFPGETALQALFTLLNAPDLDPLWAEDETIGWIYQYYNDPAERKKMRDESAAPRNSRELAVRNQFFTPRYVVEFLTDNTLGRIWYEMTQGKTRLKNQCRYLVRRPTEIFLKPGETAPETLTPEGLSQEELLKQPVYILYRPLKDPRKIGMLDPACGSMHFGLYAFDLFEAIYEEAWDLGLKSLRLDYPEKEVFLREVPRLIIEHNIHGIDIDPRATQIAGLSLWLRAQKSWQAQHVPAAQRPRIMRSNIVCAEPMPGSTELLKEFAATLQPPLLGQLMEKVFDQMQLAGEAGSLLKIEEEIANLVKEAKKLWQTRPKAEQTELSLGLEAKPKQGEFPLDVSGISDERFWETAEERIYSALRDYAEQAEYGGYQRRLFAEEAARGFAFIDLCRKRYDVVVMNPPFGEVSQGIEEHISRAFPLWSDNILCAFIERAYNLLLDYGKSGAIFDRTASIKSSYEEFRRAHLVSRITAVVDTGWDVLDANVETTTHVWNKNSTKTFCPFFDLRTIPSDQKSVQLLTALTKLNNGDKVDQVFIEYPDKFLNLPNAVIGYYFPPFLIDAFNRYVSLSNSGLQARKGNDFLSEPHFRLFWEVHNPADISPNGRYCSVYNGGRYSLFVTPLRDVAVCGLDAYLIRCNPSVYLRNDSFHFKSGIGYGKRGDILDAHILPEGFSFTSEGLAITGVTHENAILGLAYLNSAFAQFAINTFCGQHKQVGYVNMLPYPMRSSDLAKDVIENVLAIVSLRMAWLQFDETTRYFAIPLLDAKGVNVADVGQNVTAAYKVASDEVQKRIRQNDDFVLNSFGSNGIPEIDFLRYNRPIDFPWPGIEEDLPSDGFHSFVVRDFLSFAVGSLFGRWDIRFATGELQPPGLPDPFAPLPVCPPGMLQDTDGLPVEPKDVPADYALRISWPGILVDDENHPEDIVARVEDALKVIWKDRWETIEHEACGLLGVKTLHDYIRRPSGFFADHLKRYSKSRRQAPIYWPLSTAKGSYTLWIYYHRLTDQTLHTALADFVDPKLKAIRAEIGALRETNTHQTRLELLLDLEKELVDFHTEIEHIIKLPWKPNLNDGVLITASPLWKLFRLPKWQKDLKACWEKLGNGDYDWAHLAHSIWPERVENVCKKDRSIAIAHNLEHLCEAAPPKAKEKRKKATAPKESEP